MAMAMDDCDGGDEQRIPSSTKHMLCKGGRMEKRWRVGGREGGRAKGKEEARKGEDRSDWIGGEDKMYVCMYVCMCVCVCVCVCVRYGK